MLTENLQVFFESTIGQVITIGVILILFLSILITGKDKKFDSKSLVVCAILIALATVLGTITLFKMPQGGSITPFSLVPIAFAGYLYGVRSGVMVGICVGLLNLIFNPYIVHPAQLFLDYPIAFGALAFGAIFRNSKKYPLLKSYLFGVFCRYICAVISGVIFFGSYAPEGFSSLTWSLWYNITYLGVEAAFTSIIFFIPSVDRTFSKLKKEIAPS